MIFMDGVLKQLRYYENKYQSWVQLEKKITYLSS